MSIKNKPFSELFDFYPKSKIKAGQGSVNGEYPFFTCSNIQDKFLSEATFSGECLVFGTGGNPTIHYINGEFSTSTDCLVAKPKSDINVKYVYYYIFSDMSVLQRGFRGSGLKHISKSYISNLDIPEPDLIIQQKIVEVMDKATLLIQKRNEQIAFLDKLVQDAFIDMFGDPVTNPMGWDIKTVEEIADIKIGPFGTSLHVEDYISGGVPLINPQHISCGQILPREEFTISNEKYEGLSSYHLKENDIVLARRGEIGRCAVVTPELLPLICGTGSMIIRIRDVYHCSPNYLQSIISFPSYSKFMESKATGSTMKNLNSGIVSKLHIPLPHCDLQEQYSNRIIAIENQNSRLRVSLSELETIYKATMQRAFNGELFY